MGRHSRHARTGDEGAPPDADPPLPGPRPSGTRRRLPSIPVPLLPIVALVLAVGVVSYALSTQQIALNFAGGAPREPTKEGQVSQRRPGATERPDGLVVAFRLVGKTSDGFRFTTTIANRGNRPVPSWTMSFSIPNATIVAVRGATAVRTGALGLVRSPAGAPALQPGGKVKVTYLARGVARGPSSCKLNGLTCTRV